MLFDIPQREYNNGTMTYPISEWQYLVTHKPHDWFTWDRDYWGWSDTGDEHPDIGHIKVSNRLCRGAPLATPTWATHVIHLSRPIDRMNEPIVG